MPKLSIIIPCFNEKQTIAKVLLNVKRVKLPRGWSKEVIVIDDFSTDGTRDDLGGYSNIKLILREKSGGKGAALKDGFKIASGDYILIQDADLEYDPKDYIGLLKPILKGESEIVFGSRILKKNNVPFSKSYFYGGLLISKIFNLLFGTKLSDIATCYKLFPRYLVPRLIYLPSNDFVFDVIELTHQLIMSDKVIEVPINYKPRSKKEGKKINWRHGIRCLFAILRLRLSLDDLARKMRHRMALRYLKKNAVILDVGCGDLEFIKELLHKIRFAYGIDKRLKKIKRKKIKTFQLDIDKNRNWPIAENSIDQVFMLASLEHLECPEVGLINVYRTLKEGGDLIITTPTKLAKPVLNVLSFGLGVIDKKEISDHKHYFSKKELIALLRDIGFRKVEHKYFEFGFNQLIRAKK